MKVVKVKRDSGSTFNSDTSGSSDSYPPKLFRKRKMGMARTREGSRSLPLQTSCWKSRYLVQSLTVSRTIFFFLFHNPPNYITASSSQRFLSAQLFNKQLRQNKAHFTMFCSYQLINESFVRFSKFLWKRKYSLISNICGEKSHEYTCNVFSD